ncbi:MAG TPA: DUF58 domain-containing protein [Gemmatimonadales bacterium]|jgi:uncharacterized protein (DUF58 family)
MIIPSRRWYVVAAGLSVLALLALIDSRLAAVVLCADIAWVVALLVDWWRIASIDLREYPVRREAPPAFSAGRPLPVRYHWGNPWPHPVTLRVREPLPVMLRAATARERTVHLGVNRDTIDDQEIMPLRRGKATTGSLHLRVRGPWGLAWRQGRRELPWEVTVYPALRTAALRALPTQLQRRREAGWRNLRRLGEGRVFESLTEWVPGDETRSIDWKATARRGKLMTRQYEEERRQQVMIVIDAGRMLTAESGGRSRLDAAIDAALELAHSALRHDDNVGLLVFADAILAYVPPQRGRRVMRLLLDALAAIDGRLVEPDYPAAFAYLAARNRKRALTVIFTDVIDRTASDALLAQASSLRPRHLPLAVTLRDPALEAMATARPATTTAAFDRAAAEELLAAREAALSDLRSRGVMVLDVLPDGAARAVVDQYERLKRKALV